MDDRILEIKERRGKEMRRVYDLIDDHMEHCRCPDCIRFRTLHESDADIDFLLGEVERLREIRADDKRVLTDNYNALWALVYPDKPDGWEYPGQIINHIKLFLEEKDAEIARLREAEQHLERLIGALEPAIHIKGSIITLGYYDVEAIRAIIRDAKASAALSGVETSPAAASDGEK